jgi:hypothetical protein
VDACANGGVGSGHPNVAIYRRSAGMTTFWNNSTILGTVADALFYQPFTRLGGYQNASGGHRLEGNFGEVLLFDKAISDDNIIDLVEGYLRPKWCLTDCVP